MSLLSKIFTILVFIIAVANAAIIVTLFAMRTDFRDKYVKEVNAHYADIQILKAEAEAKQITIENQKATIALKDQMIRDRDNNLGEKDALLRQAEATVADLRLKFERLLSNMEALSRNLEVMISRVAELNKENNDLRASLEQTRADMSQITAQLLQAQGDLERSDRALSTAEEELIRISKEAHTMRERIDRLRQQGVPVEILPVPRLNAVVKGVALDVGVVVLSVGKEEGVTPGMKFTVYRGPEYVCTVSVDKVEARWSSAQITTRRMDPRIGDSATNAGSAGALTPAAGNP